MIAAIEPMIAANTARAPSGFSSHCLSRRSITRRKRGTYTDGMSTYPGPSSPGRNSVSQCRDFNFFHHLMAGPFLINGSCENNHSIGSGSAAYSEKPLA